MKLEVEGSEEFVRELKQRVQDLDGCESATIVDAVNDHEVDTVDLAVSRIQESRDLENVTPGEVADKAGLPRDKTKVALEKLDVLDDLR